MKNKSIFLALIVVLMSSACSDRVTVTNVERSRIIVDSRYDGKVSAEVEAFMAPYTRVVDSIMSPLVGELAADADVHRPESPLSNLLADILLWSGKNYGERPVLGVYNMGGIRASLSKGAVTNGAILEVAPFDNKICFLTLSGSNLLNLFRQMAEAGGEGVSHGVKMVITKDRKLQSVTINGREIDPSASYRIATIDYLAAGNGGLSVFKTKTDLNAPSGSENDCREVICRYFRTMKKAGKTIAPKVEGRIIIEE